MKAMKKKKTAKRICALALSFVVALTMIPLMGAGAYAEESRDLDPAILEAAEEAGIDTDDQETVRAFADALDEQGITPDTLDIKAIDDIPEDAEPLKKADGEPVDPESIPVAEVSDGEKKLAGEVSDTFEDYDADNSNLSPVTFNSTYPAILKDAKITCSIESEGDTVTYKFVPDESGFYYFYSADASGQSSFDTIGRLVEYDPASGTARQLMNDDDGEGNNFLISFSAEVGKEYYLQASLPYGDKTGTFDILLEKDEFDATINVSLNKATGIATVTGTATGDTFYDVYVDDSRCFKEIDGQPSFETTIDMKEYEVGLHTIYAELNGHEGVKVYYSKAVPTYIYSKPSNKTSFFTTGPNYFIYSYGGSSYSYDYDCGIGLDYRKKGGAWKTGYGPYSTSTAVKMTKMKSGKAYQVRTYFAKKFTYGGKGYYITGKDTGKTGKAVTIKTGGKKLRVKSLKITKAKQYSKKYTLTTWIYIGGYGYPRTTTYKYWYTDFKITLRLKKKPGAMGVCIGSKRVKGNKKKYTTTMHFSGKQKGKKLKFELCSYQSKVYKGYSKSVYKKVKVK